MNDEWVLELARIQRAAFEAVRKRIQEQQLGEAFDGIEIEVSPPIAPEQNEAR